MKTYYFSTDGNDNNSANESSPLKTVAKFNAIQSSLVAGDSIKFKCGDTFFGSLQIKKSGINIGAWGEGKNPVVTSLVDLINWVAKGNNVYESYNSLLGSFLNVVLINGVQKEMGRYPSAGYNKYEGSSSNSITDNELSTNWVGADAVVRTTHFTTERKKINSQSGGKLVMSSSFQQTPSNGFGYFIQNHIKTLSKDGDWYYNPTTKKLSVYWLNGAPQNVQAVTQSNLLLSSQDNVTIENISFIGSNDDAVRLASGSSGVKIENCLVDFSGADGIYASGTNIHILNTSVFNTSNNGIYIINADSSTIKDCTIENTYQIPGMGARIDGGNGLYLRGAVEAERNTIKNTGYIGIKFDGDDCVVKNNLVDLFCNIKDDGAGIYTQGQIIRTGQKVIGNIVLNGVGATSGGSSNALADGIYIDNNASNVLVEWNTSAHHAGKGIYLHRGQHNAVKNNVAYDCKFVFYSNADEIDEAMRNNILERNIFVAKTTAQKPVTFLSKANDIGREYDIMDHNVYARPLDDNITIKAGTLNFNLLTWTQTYPKYDQNSKKSPRPITSSDELMFYYNAKAIPQTFEFPFVAVDMHNVVYEGAIMLQPFTSVVLIKTGPYMPPEPPDEEEPPTDDNQAPVITLTSSATTYNAPATIKLTATASDSDGEIREVEFIQWPSKAHVYSRMATPYVCNIKDVKPGTYTYAAVAIDDKGKETISDPVTVTVR